MYHVGLRAIALTQPRLRGRLSHPSLREKACRPSDPLEGDPLELPAFLTPKDGRSGGCPASGVRGLAPLAQRLPFPATHKSARLGPMADDAYTRAELERARKFGAPEGDEGIVRCDACPVLCRIRPGRAGACDRYANVGGTLVRTDADRLHGARGRARHAAGAVRRPGGGLGRPHPVARTLSWAHLHHRHRRRHHLSRLQARALHRVEPARRRRHRHRGDRGHLQLLRRQGEDRHRPPSRPRAGGDPRRRRDGGSRHHRRVRLADALHRRRAAPHRRQQEGRQRHLRHAPEAVRRRGGGARHRWRPHGDRASRQGARRRRPPRGAHARRLRLRHGRHLRSAVARARRRGDRGRRPHHRRADRAPGRPLPRHAPRRHPRARAQVDARAATSRWPIPASAGAAPTSPIRWR